MRKIGGEFEIDPICLTGYVGYDLKRPYLYSSGRSALQVILSNLSCSKQHVIHLPYYICQSVIYACLNAEYQIKFYELDSNFHFPLEYLDQIEKEEVLLTINYFGFINDDYILSQIKLERPDITTISDQVQSYWTFKKTFADYSFTSLRKHFAVNEGALIHARSEFIEFKADIPESTFYSNKIVGSILKFLGYKDEIYLKFFYEGEEKLNNEFNPSKASPISHFLYENLDLENIIERRKLNYRIVYELGSDMNLDFLFPYNDEIVPLNVPILLSNRDKIRRRLKEKDIFLPIHWPINSYTYLSKFSQKLANQELSLIIDQRYSSEEIIYQIENLKSIINEEL